MFYEEKEFRQFSVIPIAKENDKVNISIKVNLESWQQIQMQYVNLLSNSNGSIYILYKRTRIFSIIALDNKFFSHVFVVYVINTNMHSFLLETYNNRGMTNKYQLIYLNLSIS